MKYALLTAVPDQVGDKKVPLLVDLHEIESVTPDTVGTESWLHLKSGNTFLIDETPEKVLELMDDSK